MFRGFIMRLPQETKEKAIKLRKNGYSLKEISEKLNIAKSTASVWLRNIKLTQKAKKRLKKRKLL
jgi:orotate phosphoribosyltransferase-like protein